MSLSIQQIQLHSAEPQIKKCTKCNQWKLLSDFIKKKSLSSGYGSICKKCYNLYKVKYEHDLKLNHPDKYKINKEKRRIKDKLSKSINRKKQLIKCQQKYFKKKYWSDPKFREKILMQRRERYRKNIDKIKLNHKKFRIKRKIDTERYNRLLALHKFYKRFPKQRPYKECIICKEFYPLTSDHFIRQTSSPDGFMDLCITCSNDKQKLHEYIILQNK